MFDVFLKWDGFIFPKVAKFIYYLGLILITIGAIVGAIGAFFAGQADGNIGIGFVGLIFSLIGGVVGALVWRIMVELWTVLFSIHDVLVEIRDKGAKS